MLILEHVRKDYVDDSGVTPALRDVSFTIKDGEFVSIMGPSGSGKSTLLHLMSFMDRPTGGTYTFAGKSSREMSDVELARLRNEAMGFVFQSFNLLGHERVYENVELPLMYAAQVMPAERHAKVTAAVAAVGLTDKIFTEASKLSGGQRQRVAIARALVNAPQVIFADEPTGNLDSASGAQVMNILQELNDHGHTIILVTHETYTAEYAARIIRIRDGAVESDERVTDRRRGELIK